MKGELKMEMKKTYEAPVILLTENDDGDIISTSAGDTPGVLPFDW